MKSISIFSVMLLLFTISTSITAQNTISESKNKSRMELSKKEKAVALIESLENHAKEPIAYINPNKYIQHNLAVGDGLAGFGEVIKNAPEGGFKAKVIRAFEDGDFVFLQTEYDFFGPKIGFDVFRFEDGLIVEHWDNLIEVKPANPSGHTQIDGATAITDTDKTAANKALVQDFVSSILVNGQMDKLGSYFDGDNYIQHNPSIGDGLSGLGAALQAMAENGITMEYHKIHRVLGEGNFVLTVSEGAFAGQPTSYYDLFRIENNKIAEHWDVMETILPEADRKNNNGKF